ncbi:uncharacterized protein LOC133737170 [Rosa rugosa]|uniref:uncharacterized protein LOC133737170 n=1 Tax=Rosa rugosa TaxID=74645 RepID=UPI002B4098CF|nr:uncharacterized protein LOC133737170 [Rosa rugosa]
MKILCWNCKGSAWPGFVAQCLFYSSSLDLDVFCLLDTRALSTLLNKLRKFPYDDFILIPAHGQCGGLILFWKTRTVTVELIKPHDRYIHCIIKDNTVNRSWLTTFVYAFPQKEKQAKLWSDLLTLQPNSEESLVSLQAQGLPYTWTNNHKDDTLIYERLDRACVNAAFLNNFPNIQLENLPIIGSDHGPICLTIKNNNAKKGKAGLQVRSNVEQHCQVTKELLQCYREEEIYWAQKAKANWLNLGDKNTRFFQTRANIRKRSNRITRIQDSTGNWIENDEGIIRTFVHDFKKRFHLDTPSVNAHLQNFTNIIEPCITSTNNASLLQPASEDEILEAVKSIGPLKAPGPDGLHAIFYQNCGTKVKDIVVPMIQSFFSENTPLNFLNLTNIALIPKIEKLEKGAFAPGRVIQDNILIAHELFSDLKKKKGTGGAMAVKLDLEKAYNYLNWNYLFTCLQKFGFHQNWIDQVRNCISSVSFSILLNGVPQGHFSPTQGIRQGDHFPRICSSWLWNH